MKNDVHLRKAISIKVWWTRFAANIRMLLATHTGGTGPMPEQGITVQGYSNSWFYADTTRNACTPKVFGSLLSFTV